MGDWISVKDRLPEYTAHAGGSRFAVVIANCSGFVSEAMYEEGEWKMMTVDDAPVTHWMPLPEPPKE